MHFAWYADITFIGRTRARSTRRREAHDLPTSTRDYRAISRCLADRHGSQRGDGDGGLEPLFPQHRRCPPKPSSFASQLYQLFSVLHDAGASQRGYLLTGNAAYREAFTNADRTFPAAFERIAASVKARPGGANGLSRVASPGWPRTGGTAPGHRAARRERSRRARGGRQS